MEVCIFCKIVNKEIPSAIVYEDDNILSFLDIMPANKWHCLVIPKNHYETLLDITEEELSFLIIKVKKIAKAMSLAMGNESYNIVMNNGKEAGQVVPHGHIHIIPRFNHDGVRIHSWDHKMYKEKEIDEFKDKIKKKMVS